MSLDIPPSLRLLLDDVRKAGGRALLVGGCVRDALLGQPTLDLDVEVHDLDVVTLREVLGRHGQLNEVGRSFGVFKLRLDGREVDVALPRRDSKVGAGHRGISARSDPALGVREAARRRDLTINAIAYDPLANVVEDPFGGVADIRERRMRAVDRATFGEDPLRALRVAQFAARLGFTLDPELCDLCRAAPLTELPAERVLGEVEKLLLLGNPPSAGWDVAWRLGLWAQVVPPWDIAPPPDLDRLAALPFAPPARRLAVLLACTASGPRAMEIILDRLNVHRWKGTDVRRIASNLVGARAEPHVDRDIDTRARRLADRVDVELYAALVDDPALAQRARALGVLDRPLPRLLSGADGTSLGVAAGPALGAWLHRAREAQILGHFDSREGALAWARAHLG